jgi:Glycosyl transferase family 2
MSSVLVLAGTDDVAAVAGLAGVSVDASWVVDRGLAAESGPAAAYDRRKSPDLDRFVLGAASLADVRRVLPLLGRYGWAARVCIAVLATDRPGQFAIPTTLCAEQVARAGIRIEDGGAGGVVVALEIRGSASVQAVLRAVCGGPRAAGATFPAAGLRVGVSDLSALAWTRGDPWARPVSPRSLQVLPGDVPSTDVVVGARVGAAPADGDEPPHLAYGAAAPGAAQAASWTWAARAGGRDLDRFLDGLDTEALLPPVDTATVSPQGFLREVEPRTARIERAAQGQGLAVLDDAGRRLAALDPVRGVTENDVALLRPFQRVDLDPSCADGPAPLAAALSALAVAGVPVRTGPLPETVRLLLGPDLAKTLESLDEARAADPLARESWSVTTRRTALLRFSPASRWRSAGRRIGRPTAPDASVSVILATKRVANLPFALTQVARQSWPDSELVLALHGISARNPAVVAALADFPRPVNVLGVDADVIFGEVLNAALDRCSGRFVAKMDDDDWYGPHHLTDLVLAHSYSGAMLVGIADHFTYLEATDTTIRDVRHGTEQWATRVSGGTLLVARDDLLAVGRWRPVRRAVDRMLIQGVAAAGGHTYSMHDLGFCLYRGSGDHTWNPGDEHFLARAPQSWAGFRPPDQLQATPRP